MNHFLKTSLLAVALTGSICAETILTSSFVDQAIICASQNTDESVAIMRKLMNGLRACTPADTLTAIETFSPERFAAVAAIAANEDMRAHQIARVVARSAWNIDAVRMRWHESADDELKQKINEYKVEDRDAQSNSFDLAYAIAVRDACSYHAIEDLKNTPQTIEQLFAAAHSVPMVTKAEEFVLPSGARTVKTIAKEYLQLNYQLPDATNKELAALSTRDIDTIIALKGHSGVLLRLITHTDQAILQRFSPSAIEGLTSHTLREERHQSILANCLTAHRMSRTCGRKGMRCLCMVYVVNLLEEFDARATDAIRATYTQATKDALAKIKKSSTAAC